MHSAQIYVTQLTSCRKIIFRSFCLLFWFDFFFSIFSLKKVKDSSVSKKKEVNNHVQYCICWMEYDCKMWHCSSHNIRTSAVEYFSPLLKLNATICCLRHNLCMKSDCYMPYRWYKTDTVCISSTRLYFLYLLLLLLLYVCLYFIENVNSTTGISIKIISAAVRQIYEFLYGFVCVCVCAS